MSELSWIELSAPALVERARRRKAFYEQWVTEYDALGWWGRVLKRNRDFVVPSIMRQWAEAPIDDHIEFCQNKNAW